VSAYLDWCKQRGVTHAHCFYFCEHPQPFILNGKLVCGRCYFVYGEVSEVVPCTPENCR
jgi:hypothetical protein